MSEKKLCENCKNKRISPTVTVSLKIEEAFTMLIKAIEEEFSPNEEVLIGHFTKTLYEMKEKYK